MESATRICTTYRLGICSSSWNFLLIVMMTMLSCLSASYLNGTDVIVGVVSTGEFSETTMQEQWGPTFKTLLTESVGQHLSPPRNFSLYLLDVPTAFQMVREKAIDFIFSTPSLFSCLEYEDSGEIPFLKVFKCSEAVPKLDPVSAVVTLRNLVGDTESNSFGGVIFARADNDLVQTVQDVDNRIVIASSVYEMGSGPMQWEQMRAAGEDLLFAPSQASIQYYLFLAKNLFSSTERI